MIKVKKSIVINKPVGQVFAFVTDSSNSTKWQAGLVRIEDGGQPNVVGSQYTTVRKLMGQEFRSTMQVTAMDANARWAVKVVKGPVPFEITNTFETVGDGTKYTTLVEAEPKGFFKVAEGVLKGQLEKSLEEDFNRLKGILEGA
jgi:hypothetical protein